MTYKSKIEWWFFLLVVSWTVLSGYFIYLGFAKDSTISILLGVLIFSWVPLYFVPLIITTNYTLDEKELIVRSWIRKWSIPYASIISITETSSIMQGPALSFNRIAIKYRHKSSLGTIYISPVNKSNFVNALNEKLIKER